MVTGCGLCICQPQIIKAGLREIFINRYTVQRTTKGELRPKNNNNNNKKHEKNNRVRMWRIVGRIYEMKYSSKGNKSKTDTRTK